MKKILTIIASVVALTVSCSQFDEDKGGNVVVLDEGPLELSDTRFSMYYGNLNYDGVGIYTVVLSDARCYQDILNLPYMDSEGDMLMLRLRSGLLADNAELAIPLGEYAFSADGTGLNVFDARGSYVKRFVGNTQSKWAIKGGKVKFEKDAEGNYMMTTENLVISKGKVVENVEYFCKADIHLADFQFEAPGNITFEDDIIDMPFPDVECAYYGDLYGSQTGNFVVNMLTKGLRDDNTGKLPGVYITLNFFSKLFAEGADPELPEGIYNVSTATSNSLFQQWSVLPGLLYESSPFGSYVVQQFANGTGGYEFITSGTVKVSYESASATRAYGREIMVLEYDLKTNSRSVKGIWKGECEVQNESDGGTVESYLSTLTDDVHCDMSKVQSAVLTHVETIRRSIIESQPVEGENNKYHDVDVGYDVADAWRVYLQPRDWTQAEKDIPWVDPNASTNPETGEPVPGPYDRGDKGGIAGNGIHDRLDVWCADGDVMVLEFILPLNEVKGHSTAMAPEIGVEYTYTMQPHLDYRERKTNNYDAFVSRLGRPMDEIFDEKLVEMSPDNVKEGYQAWKDMLGIKNYERCNARRGYTWSTDGFRGNWYLRYEKGRHQVLEGHAPAINGWVKVKRTSEDIYTFQWEFIDDCPDSPNTISGKMENCVVSIQPKA